MKGCRGVGPLQPDILLTEKIPSERGTRSAAWGRTGPGSAKCAHWIAAADRGHADSLDGQADVPFSKTGIKRWVVDASPI